MIARLFHAPLDNPDAQALGVSTIGSSEAIILSVREFSLFAHSNKFTPKQVLAAKRRWQNMRKAAGKPFDKPNIVMSAAVQVCCASLSFIPALVPHLRFRGKGCQMSVFLFLECDTTLSVEFTDLEVEEKFWCVTISVTIREPLEATGE